MLEKILDYIHNYFVKEVYRGHFKIESGVLEVHFLKEGQYFKIVGSALNDGVYQYSTTVPEEPILIDETFVGEVWAMAVPRSLINLANEIKAWVDQYGEIADSPYQSESFGGYSYTKANQSGSQDKSAKSSWQLKFDSQLNAYRKIS